jgi:hypothetical protein
MTSHNLFTPKESAPQRAGPQYRGGMWSKCTLTAGERFKWEYNDFSREYYIQDQCDHVCLTHSHSIRVEKFAAKSENNTTFNFMDCLNFYTLATFYISGIVFANIVVQVLGTDVLDEIDLKVNNNSESRYSSQSDKLCCPTIKDGNSESRYSSQSDKLCCPTIKDGNSESRYSQSDKLCCPTIKDGNSDSHYSSQYDKLFYPTIIDSNAESVHEVPTNISITTSENVAVKSPPDLIQIKFIDSGHEELSDVFKTKDDMGLLAQNEEVDQSFACENKNESTALAQNLPIILPKYAAEGKKVCINTDGDLSISSNAAEGEIVCIDCLPFPKVFGAVDRVWEFSVETTAYILLPSYNLFKRMNKFL